MNEGRNQAVVFSSYFYVIRYGFQLAKPKRIEAFLKVFEPLNPLVWLGIFLAAIGTGLLSICLKTQHPCLKDIYASNFEVSSLASCYFLIFTMQIIYRYSGGQLLPWSNQSMSRN